MRKRQMLQGMDKGNLDLLYESRSKHRDVRYCSSSEEIKIISYSSSTSWSSYSSSASSNNREIS